jgi:uncharacterized protein (TIGR02757 family)
MFFKNEKDLHLFLDEMVVKMNHQDFIESDPISIPHRFQKKQDIEIAGFFSAVFSWGNRKTIIKKSEELMSLMDNEPFDFIKNHSEKDLNSLQFFKHRTFQYTDLLYFISFFKHHYVKSNTLEDAFLIKNKGKYLQKTALENFYSYFFSLPYAPQRTRKHISTPAKNATCKRLNMYLRWMVRKDTKGVDFGIWNKIPCSQLMIPFDVHVEKTAMKLGLLNRKQRDWVAVEELTNKLKKFDPVDPIKYDFALFGLSVEKMI